MDSTIGRTHSWLSVYITCASQLARKVNFVGKGQLQELGLVCERSNSCETLDARNVNTHMKNHDNRCKEDILLGGLKECVLCCKAVKECGCVESKNGELKVLMLLYTGASLNLILRPGSSALIQSIAPAGDPLHAIHNYQSQCQPCP